MLATIPFDNGGARNALSMGVKRMEECVTSLVQYGNRIKMFCDKKLSANHPLNGIENSEIEGPFANRWVRKWAFGLTHEAGA